MDESEKEIALWPRFLHVLETTKSGTVQPFRLADLV